MMLLGDEVAITLGRDLHRYRQVYLIISSLIIGFVVYAAGMIGFVGLLIPHLVRMTIGTNHWTLIPFSALGGSIFLVIAEMVSVVALFLMQNYQLVFSFLSSVRQPLCTCWYVRTTDLEGNNEHTSR